MFKNLIFPGWAIPPHYYTRYAGSVLDYGFFRDDGPGVFEWTEGDLDEDCTITAHSLGSLSALKAAAASPHVKALVLFSPFARFCAAPGCPGQSEENLLKMIAQLEISPERLLKSFHRTFARPSSFKIDIPGFLNRNALRSGLEFLLRCDCRDCMKDIKVPVLIMLGGHDEISPRVMGEYLAEKLPDAKLCVFEDAGHALPFTDTEKCRTEIKNFIQNRKLL